MCYLNYYSEVFSSFEKPVFVVSCVPCLAVHNLWLMLIAQAHVLITERDMHVVFRVSGAVGVERRREYLCVLCRSRILALGDQ